MKFDIDVRTDEVYFSIQFEGKKLTTVLSYDESLEGVLCHYYGNPYGFLINLAASLITAHMEKGMGECLPL